MKEKLVQRFMELYGSSKEEINLYFAPGRVNLIGEHIDYNGGFVFPCALDMGTYLVIRKREDLKVKFATMNFDYRTEIDLSEEIQYSKKDGWANYPKGIIKEFLDRKIEGIGLDLLYYGNIPNGSGLSSSASLEVVTAFAVNEQYHGALNLIDLVKLSQKTEVEFIGVNCGIMDQFAVAFGQKDKAILLDCNTLEYEYAPLVLDNHKIVICNTNKKRGLGDSKYNERTKECAYALQRLQKEMDIKHLCEVSLEEFELNKELIDQEIPLKRAIHAVKENDRVLRAVAALKENDIEAFGKLITQSHESLRDLYEVSCYELDVMVEEALKIEGTLGARMTGAGFGGCTVNIVRNDAVEEFVSKVATAYADRTKLKPEIYIASAHDGVKKI